MAGTALGAADDAVDIALGVDVPVGPLGVEAGENHKCHFLIGGGIVKIGVLLRPAGVVVAQKRLEHLLAGIVGGGGGVPAAVFPVVAVNDGIAGKAVRRTELRSGLGPQNTVVALATVQPAVQVVVILIGILQDGVIDIGAGDLEPGLDITVKGLVVADIGGTGIAVIHRRLEVPAGFGGGKCSPGAAALLPAGQLGAGARRCGGLAGLLGGLGFFGLLGSLLQGGIGLFAGLGHIGGQVGCSGGAPLCGGLLHALVLLDLQIGGGGQCVSQGGIGTGGHNAVDAEGDPDAQDKARCTDEESSGAVFFSPLGFGLFGGFCHICLLLSGGMVLDRQGCRLSEIV